MEDIFERAGGRLLVSTSLDSKDNRNRDRSHDRGEFLEFATFVACISFCVFLVQSLTSFLVVLSADFETTGRFVHA